MTDPARRIAIAGASGYVGRLLAKQLAGAGHQVLALGRTPGTLPSGERISAVAVDVADAEATAAALAGADAAYYLVHAMAGGTGFEARDRRLAVAFGEAAKAAGVGRIIYLGGLGRGDLSAHLDSRQEVGAVLAASGVPVVELRAAVILGAGSISYEMLRSLTERLPVMVCPRWITTRLQPLAECDLLDYLAGSLVAPPAVYEIGTPDVTDYGSMMCRYAEARGLRPRRIFTVPFVTPSLSARWVDLVSPVDRRISHTLIESLTNEVVVHDAEHTYSAFGITPLPVGEAVRRAISDEADRVSAGLFDGSEGLGTGVYAIRCAAPVDPDRLESVRDDLARVGGDLSWYGVTWAWALRLAFGRIFGEHLVTRRPDRLTPGEAADWWEVVRSDPDHLVLASVGWFCGDGWLGLRVTDAPPRVEQAAAFRPKGLLGLAYWWALWPVHQVVFRLMLRRRAGGGGGRAGPVAADARTADSVGATTAA
ncbi:MAG TPA: SDR family oxidoreductase [Acidimicrobiales bacterium]|nr:SDR family oxidoreductase [Acidimicrobiales bacterium]